MLRAQTLLITAAAAAAAKKSQKILLINRRCLVAAATGFTKAQKRALNRQQLEADAKKGGGKPPFTSPPPPSSGGPKPPLAATTAAADKSSSSSNILLPLAAVGVLALGGGAYYYSTLPETDNTAAVGAPASSSSDEKAAPKTTETPSSSVSSSPEQVAVVAKETTSTVDDATDSESSGHRVVSIEVPSKMKNDASRAAPVAAPPSHPTDGHRVVNITAPAASTQTTTTKEETPIDDASSTQKALAALRETTQREASEVLAHSQRSVSLLLEDHDNLSESQLRARIAQLTSEMNDRTKWEAVRLKEFLVMKEKETEEKYLGILQKQRLEFEDLLAKRLREQEHELTTRMNKALQEKDATIQKVLEEAVETQRNEHETDKKAFEQLKTAEIQSSLEEQYGKIMEEYKQKVAQDLNQKVQTLDALGKKLRELETALEASKTSKQGSLKAHRLSAAALALAEKLETNESAAKELAALKLAAGNEGVIATACATIPSAVRTGVPTLPELQARFETASTKCRQAALVPPGRPGLDGQLAGILFATVKYPPNPDDPAPENAKDSAEYVLVRAQTHVRNGELERAVEQLEKLSGQPAFTIEDWKKDAIDRIAVEKALKVIKMECALLNESCLDDEKE